MQKLATFIRLENSLEKAMRYYNSPQMTEYIFRGVHLLPNNQNYYRQRTNSKDGIEIEEYTVLVKSLCGTILGDITDYFDVVNVFQDEITGLPQVDWELINVPLDFGYRNIYLEIQTGVNTFVYSSPFMLTNQHGDYTSQFFYRNASDAYLMSIGVTLYFRQPMTEQELTVYTPISTGVQYTSAIKNIKYDRCNFGSSDVYVLEEFKDMFGCPYVYCDYTNFNEEPVFVTLKEAIDTPELEMDENYIESEVLLSRDLSIVLNPYDEDITPPQPEPGDPFILLIRVDRVNSNLVNMVFTYGNFSPTNLVFQYASNPTGPWTSSTKTPTSPKEVITGDNIINNYYYRIYHYGTGTTSNIKQIETRTIGIDSIVATENPREYNVGYNINFNPEPGKIILIESSNNGDDWSKTISDYNNNNPKKFQVVESIPAMDRIRLKYDETISETQFLPGFII